MSNLNVVYRLDDPGTENEEWSSYSFPYGIYVGGSTLDEVRAEFREAAETVTELEGVQVLEHIERPIDAVPGAYIRVAVDRHMLDREQVFNQMQGSMIVRAQRDDFVERSPIAASGDAVVIACVSTDRLGWVFEQMTDHDGIALCAAGPITTGGSLVWWSFIIGMAGDRYDATGDTETLGDAGLDSESTVGDFMRATSAKTGRRLLVGAP